jgi:hypothetical protein
VDLRFIGRLVGADMARERNGRLVDSAESIWSAVSGSEEGGIGWGGSASATGLVATVAPCLSWSMKDNSEDGTR